MRLWVLLQVYGSGLSDDKVMETLLEFWPQGRMGLPEVMAALGRALENPKAGNRGPRKSLEGVDTLGSDSHNPESAVAGALIDQAQQARTAGRYRLCFCLGLKPSRTHRKRGLCV